MPCPLTLITVGEGTLTHMASIFFELIVKLTWLLNMLSQSVFSWICCQVWDNRAKLSAKLGSSSVEKGVHLMPLHWSSSVQWRTQSIAILNSTDDMTHPCCTPVLILKLSSPGRRNMWSSSRSICRYWQWVVECHMLSESAKDYPFECCQTLSRNHNCLFLSEHCSSIFRSVKIWSLQPRPLRNPACSFLRMSSTARVIRCIMTL